MEAPWHQLTVRIGWPEQANRAGFIQRMSYEMVSTIDYLSLFREEMIPDSLNDIWHGMEKWRGLDSDAEKNQRYLFDLDADIKEGLKHYSTRTLAVIFHIAQGCDEYVREGDSLIPPFYGGLGSHLIDLLLPADANPDLVASQCNVIEDSNPRSVPEAGFHGGFQYRVEEIDWGVTAKHAFDFSWPNEEGSRVLVPCGRLSRTNRAQGSSWQLCTSYRVPLLLEYMEPVTPDAIIDSWGISHRLETYDLAEEEAWAWWSANGGPTAVYLPLGSVDIHTPIGTYRC